MSDDQYRSWIETEPLSKAERRPASIEYPRSLSERVDPDVDPTLGRWGRRRARKAARKAAGQERRAAYGRQVAAWRRFDPDQINGLGVVLALVALVFAGYVLFVRVDNDPAEPASAPTAAQDTTAGTRAPASTAPTAQPTLTGSDDEGAVIALDGPGGDVAGQLLTAYNTYTPTLPDAPGTWVASWSAWATDEAVDAGRAAVNRLWDFTVRDQVTVGGPQLTGQPVILAGDQGQTTYEVTVTRQLHAVGDPPDAPTTPEVVRWRLVVVGTDTPTPLVATVQQLNAATTPEDDGGTTP